MDPEFWRKILFLCLILEPHSTPADGLHLWASHMTAISHKSCLLDNATALWLVDYSLRSSPLSWLADILVHTPRGQNGCVDVLGLNLRSMHLICISRAFCSFYAQWYTIKRKQLHNNCIRLFNIYYCFIQTSNIISFVRFSFHLNHVQIYSTSTAAFSFSALKPSIKYILHNLLCFKFILHRSSILQELYIIHLSCLLKKSRSSAHVFIHLKVLKTLHGHEIIFKYL